MDHIDLDLDSLTTPAKVVRLGGEMIEIQAPDVQSLFELMRAGNKMKDFEKSDPTQVEGVLNEFRAAIDRTIPQMKGKSLSLQQLFKLLELVTEMAIPNDLQAMEKAGIKIDPEQKKILSDSLERSQDSSISTQDTQPLQS